MFAGAKFLIIAEIEHQSVAR